MTKAKKASEVTAPAMHLTTSAPPAHFPSEAERGAGLDNQATLVPEHAQERI